MLALDCDGTIARGVLDPEVRVRFEQEAKEMMLAEKYKSLINYEILGPQAILSIPTLGHIAIAGCDRRRTGRRKHQFSNGRRGRWIDLNAESRIKIVYDAR